ncbi:hypothetical protein DRF60_12985 [Chryseobacterium elymi]|uniref:PKD domain-containing protein n=1 Tax=Chryseobacterium elymi TaxID=395936 RepID=A0A3D9DG50_9FLAO|nr:PKD domain-containing protein [Chryseobacterium elymi]REC76801.1 hypothetical protein DRF60_12985 [Chryseobacterium elymi]
MKKSIFLFLLFCAMLINAQNTIAKFLIETGTTTNSVKYTNQSSDVPSGATYEWEFPSGNPITSTDTAPLITYAGLGNYTATLKVKNASGEIISTVTKTFSISERTKIDLSTGRNDDGTLMPITSVADNDWKYTDPNGLVSTPITRYKASGWSYAQLLQGVQNSEWITGNNVIAGNHIYESKSFIIPESVSDAKLSLRALTFLRNWVYLVKENQDNTTTENQIISTELMYGTKWYGWLNSWNPPVNELPVSPGKYHLKVVGYTNSTAQRQAIDVNANVVYGTGIVENPSVEFTTNSSSLCIGNPVTFTTSTQGNLYNWTFTNGATTLNSTNQNPVINFTVPGKYDATLQVTYPNGQISTLSISDYLDVQNCDNTRAPNSYIFTGKDKSGNDVDGLYIPVKKAYAMWDNDAYIGGEPIIAGTQNASLYWEDVSGLVKSVNLEGSGENSKIKILIDKAKGKGNAVIAFKVNGEIKWSWHIWVTDDPTHGSTYRKGFEKNKNGQLIPDNQWQWMDRNLGATNASFLGNDWNKSAGLMYQWGRKDPFPPLQYKDGTGYEIYGEIGEKQYGDFKKIDENNTTNPIGWVFRPFNSAGNHNEVAQNLKYAVKNPLRMITFLGSAGSTNKETWFSDSRFKVDASDVLQRVNFDLWGDTRKGFASRVNTGDAALKLDSETYELKSAFDPCPNGWRIPSHYGSSNGASGGMNLSSPWGRGGGGNDDIWNDYSTTFFLNNNKNKNYQNIGSPSSNFTIGGYDATTTNNMLPDVKVYPSLGFDFNDQANRNLGFMPMPGAYCFVGPYEVGDYVNETPQLKYFLSLNRGILHTSTLSTYSSNGEMGLWFRTDNYKTAQEGNFIFAVGQTTSLKGAEPCRCIKDPNLEFIGDFETEYVAATNSVDYELLKEWSKDANSYIVMTNETQNQKIKTRKAYAMHKLKLSGENFEFPSNLSVHAVWTTNANLINSLTLTNTTIENSEINVKLNANQFGNAVVALHAGNSNEDPILWSWHIWAPETNPEENTITYQTESVVNHPNSQIINHTKHAVVPPLKTIFMDRNLGAIDVLPVENPTQQAYEKSIGLHYQWGRKDPIPTFLDQSNIMIKGLSNTSSQYNTSFITDISHFNSIFNDAGLRQNEKDSKVIKYTVENPLNFIYNSSKKDWISNKQGMKTDRWGHATEKSPYDPCPEGWRVPDTSLVFFNYSYVGNGSTNHIANDGRKGYSPWYLGDVLDPNNSQGRYGINQFSVNNNDNAATHSSYYRGSYIGNDYGWSFNDPLYKLGTFPRTGIRGESTSGVSNDFPKTLVWTAALDDDMVGKAFGLSIRWSKMQTGGQASPALGASCRCAKDEARYSGLPASAQNNEKKQTNILKEKESINLKLDDIKLYPNPVDDILYINTEKEMKYKIYDMSGVLVKSGRFEDNRINISNLKEGVYIIQLNNEITFKIIKQ